jgi:hypothetical protein
MSTVIAYCIYITLSLAITLWVATTLHKNGKIFLVDAFHGNLEMANAVNHLLQVGFYLVNIGFVALFLRYGETPNNAVETFEYISSKMGVVLLMLGAMHFFNMLNFAKMRGKAKKSLEPRQTPNLEPQNNWGGY